MALVPSILDAMSTPNTTRTPRLAKVKRHAESLGVPYTTLRDAGIRGEYPLVKVGKALYAEYRDIDHWLETRKAHA